MAKTVYKLKLVVITQNRIRGSRQSNHSNDGTKHETTWDKLRALLAPWRADLCCLRTWVPLRIYCDDRDDYFRDSPGARCVLWLRPNDRDDAALTIRAIEGLCVLQVLAHVDVEAWRRGLVLLWQRDCGEVLPCVEAHRMSEYRNGPLSRPLWTYGLELGAFAAQCSLHLPASSVFERVCQVLTAELREVDSVAISGLCTLPLRVLVSYDQPTKDLVSCHTLYCRVVAESPIPYKTCD